MNRMPTCEGTRQHGFDKSNIGSHPVFWSLLQPPYPASPGEDMLGVLERKRRITRPCPSKIALRQATMRHLLAAPRYNRTLARWSCVCSRSYSHTGKLYAAALSSVTAISRFMYLMRVPRWHSDLTRAMTARHSRSLAIVASKRPTWWLSRGSLAKTFPLALHQPTLGRTARRHYGLPLKVGSSVAISVATNI